jgi:sugar phosphate isomerase/epimerase
VSAVSREPDAGIPDSGSDPRLARFSLNQRTVPGWSVPELVAACAAADVPAVGLWREPVADFGLEATATAVADHGLRVSSLCRGGFLTAADAAGRRAALDDNRRAIEEAARLGAACLVLVVGGLPPGSRDLAGARERVRDVLGELAPEAGASGVRLALEALHPMFAADRAVISTLAQALRLAVEHPAEQVGVVVDAYHQWWDPDLDDVLRRAAGRIAAYQVCDWVPLGPDALLSRGVMGEGCIDLAGMTRAVEAAGWAGDVEVEIFSAGLWAAPPREAFDAVLRGFLEHVAPYCSPVAPAGDARPGGPP